MPRRSIPRSKSLILPDVLNPFVHQLHLSFWDKLQIAVMSVTIAPIRLILIFFCLLTGWILASIALAGRTEEDRKQPMTGWRRRFVAPLTALGKAIFFLCSFHHVEVKGQRATTEEAPLFTAAPHSSFFDVILTFYCGLASGVSRVENAAAPILGKLARFSQPVFVSREDPDSRLNTIKEIKSRAQTGGKWPQILIFPEGTCTNRSCLITFKPGAFYPGVPVQPICVKYKNKMDTITWTWDGPGAFAVFWLTICQLHSSLEIEFLPVYTPSEEEKEDAKLFANNVREVMAKALGVPVTDHTFEDCRLMNYAAKLDFPAAAGLVEFNKLRKKLGVNYDNIKEHLEKFMKIAHKTTGDITLPQFAQYLDLPVSEALVEMFNLYDRDGSGTIDFREYVIGLSLLAAPANNEETIKVAFKLFDKNNSGYISQTDLTEMLGSAFGVEEEDAVKLFHQVDSDADGKINYDEFKAYALMKPEYARLFLTYQEIKDLKDDDAEDAASEPAGPKVKQQ